MKKVTFLMLGTLIIAGGLLVSCQKKAPHCHPNKMGECQPCKPKPKPEPTPSCHPDKPCGPCKRY